MYMFTEFLSPAKQFDDRRLLKTKPVWCELSRDFTLAPGSLLSPAFTSISYS